MSKMEPEFVALLGIFLGWVLSTFSATLKYRNDRKSDLSTAISRLLPELSNIQALQSTAEGFKDTMESWADYEETRTRLWDRHGKFFQDDAVTDWNHIIDRIAKHKPILAVKVRGLMHLARKLASTKLPEAAASSTEGYVKLLSALEVGHAGLIHELESAIRRLSWAGGVSLGISFERFTMKRGGGRKMRKKSAKFIRKLHLDVWGDLNPKATAEAEK